MTYRQTHDLGCTAVFALLFALGFLFGYFIL
jgi:hypothetical protein